MDTDIYAEELQFVYLLKPLQTLRFLHDSTKDSRMRGRLMLDRPAEHATPPEGTTCPRHDCHPPSGHRLPPMCPPTPSSSTKPSPPLLATISESPTVGRHATSPRNLQKPLPPSVSIEDNCPPTQQPRNPNPSSDLSHRRQSTVSSPPTLYLHSTRDEVTSSCVLSTSSPRS